MYGARLGAFSRPLSAATRARSTNDREELHPLDGCVMQKNHARVGFRGSAPLCLSRGLIRLGGLHHEHSEHAVEEALAASVQNLMSCGSGLLELP